MPWVTRRWVMNPQGKRYYYYYLGRYEGWDHVKKRPIVKWVCLGSDIGDRRSLLIKRLRRHRESLKAQLRKVDELLEAIERSEEAEAGGKGFS